MWLVIAVFTVIVVSIGTGAIAGATDRLLPTIIGGALLTAVVAVVVPLAWWVSSLIGVVWNWTV